MFPVHRPRRLRSNEVLRSMVRETTLSPSDFIYPVFATYGQNTRREISSMPGCFQESSDLLLESVREAWNLGVPSIIIFGIPEHKDPSGTEAYAKDGVVQEAIRRIKDALPDLVVITDVCLCEFTDHGHCGIVRDGIVMNDPTLELLARMAVSHVEAGADMVAPSDMMDGRVGAIRKALDAHGFGRIPIMSYAAKYASAFYGPFREAAESTPQFGDRKSYQMDPANARESLHEVELDLQEGADIVMVKPALSYLDVIRIIRERVNIPVAAYNVSGEYSMVKAGAKLGWVDGDRVMLEILTSIRRAGADLILTYHAKEAAALLNR